MNTAPILIFFLFTFLSSPVRGQHFFRISADISIKEKNSEGYSQLTKGKVYYDKNIKKLIYTFSFPEKETWVTQDTTTYRIVNNKLIGTIPVFNTNESSVFHIALNGNLLSYGLKNTIFEMTEVEESDGMVISTWRTQPRLAEKFGKVIMSQKDKKLFGIVIFSPKEEILSKQFFRNYYTVKGMDFPTEIVQILYKDGKENYKVTSFKNIVINDIKDENIYNYIIPQ